MQVNKKVIIIFSLIVLVFCCLSVLCVLLLSNFYTSYSDRIPTDNSINPTVTFVPITASPRPTNTETTNDLGNGSDTGNTDSETDDNCVTIPGTETIVDQASGLFTTIIPASNTTNFKKAADMIKGMQMEISESGLPGNLKNSCSGANYEYIAELSITKPQTLDYARTLIYITSQDLLSSKLNEVSIAVIVFGLDSNEIVVNSSTLRASDLVGDAQVSQCLYSIENSTTKSLDSDCLGGIIKNNELAIKRAEQEAIRIISIFEQSSR